MAIKVGDITAKKVYLGDTLIYRQQPVGRGVYMVAAGQTVPTQVIGITWYSNDSCFRKTISNNVGDMIYVTTDGEPPLLDTSNICLVYGCIQVSGTFTAVTGCYYSDGEHEGPLYLMV